MSCGRKKALHYLNEFSNFREKIPWDCFVYIMTKILGFEMVKKRGSRRLFVKGEIRFNVDEPHGKGDDYIHKSDRMRALNAIKMLDPQ